MPPPPRKNPPRARQGLRFGIVVHVVAVARSRGHLRALGVKRCPRHSSLPRSFGRASLRRLCSFLVPAGTLDPAPCGGQERLSVLLPQNPLVNGFAKPKDRAGEHQPQRRGRVGLPTVALAKVGVGRSRRGASQDRAWQTPRSPKRGSRLPAPTIPTPSPALAAGGAAMANRHAAPPSPHPRETSKKRLKREATSTAIGMAGNECFDHIDNLLLLMAGKG